MVNHRHIKLVLVLSGCIGLSENSKAQWSFPGSTIDAPTYVPLKMDNYKEELYNNVIALSNILGDATKAEIRNDLIERIVAGMRDGLPVEQAVKIKIYDSAVSALKDSLNRKELFKTYAKDMAKGVLLGILIDIVRNTIIDIYTPLYGKTSAIIMASAVDVTLNMAVASKSGITGQILYLSSVYINLGAETGTAIQAAISLEKAGALSQLVNMYILYKKKYDEAIGDEKSKIIYEYFAEVEKLKIGCIVTCSVIDGNSAILWGKNSDVESAVYFLSNPTLNGTGAGSTLPVNLNPDKPFLSSSTDVPRVVSGTITCVAAPCTGTNVVITPASPTPVAEWGGMMTSVNVLPQSRFYPAFGAKTGQFGSLAVPTRESFTINVLGPNIPNGTSVTALAVGSDRSHFWSNRFSELDDTHYSRFSHTAWGRWTGSLQTTDDATGLSHTLTTGLWVIGNRTPEAAMPRQGSATFAGGVVADHISATGVTTQNGVTGHIGLIANFASNSVSGYMSLARNGIAWANPSFSNLSINKVASSSADVGRFSIFTGALTASNGGGALYGQFYGPTGPTEAGGYMSFRRNDGEIANGVFRARTGVTPHTPEFYGPVIVPPPAAEWRTEAAYVQTRPDGSWAAMGSVNLEERGAVPAAYGQPVMYGIPASNNGNAIITPSLDSGYQYTSWGEWSGNINVVYSNNQNTSQSWRNLLVVRGQTTDPSQVPTSGSATYNGDIQAFSGLYANGNSTQTQRVNGSLQLTANFGSNLIGGQMTINGIDGNPWLRTSLNGGQIYRTDSARFGGQITSVTDLRSNTSSTVQGAYNGSFYGPSPTVNGVLAAPPELGGSFGFGNNGVAIYGVFRGRR